ncbi:putative signal peptide protein [Puccinia sorghi]|uniref:Putative signal peptide protein n=1 Tax=Puccinia sorghi TaxID=27349 RepID=A0A0L6V301_9BASI|nr:putative signal peptide protein [Puccinia sorghi]
MFFFTFFSFFFFGLHDLIERKIIWDIVRMIKIKELQCPPPTHQVLVYQLLVC